MIVPDSYTENLSEPVRRLFFKWRQFMYSSVKYNRPDSLIHGMGHYERVLLYALMVAEKELPGDEEAMEILAHAAVWHDSRRLDEYLDTGHGARAAVYYHEYCSVNPEFKCHPEVEDIMRYHDIDDRIGNERIQRDFGDRAEYVKKLYHIFKDADALDRWRLGDTGLDPKFLRTDTARNLTSFSRKLVLDTMDSDFLEEISEEVRRTQKENKWKGC